MEYTPGFELTTLAAIGTDCTGSCKSSYQTITNTTTMIPLEPIWKEFSSNIMVLIKARWGKYDSGNFTGAIIWYRILLGSYAAPLCISYRIEIWKLFLINYNVNFQYCEITFIRGVPVFVGRLIHEIKNPMNNETWEAVWHRYIAVLQWPPLLDQLHRVQ